MKPTSGFTLIEISIVLVIIGLLVGGILVGRDLIDAAYTRAQISQIEKYNAAVRTFQGKYGYLPGDIPAPYAQNFGFVSRGTTGAQKNGDGFLEGYDGGSNVAGRQQSAGETITFWMDLNKAKLIEGSFTSGSSFFTANVSGTSIGLYFPTAKINQGNYIYAYNGGYWSGGVGWTGDGFNYFGISVITLCDYNLTSNPGLTVQQAYNIDQKIDDGLPQSGNVKAVYLTNSIATNGWVWAAGGGVQGANDGSATIPGPTTTATPGSATTCYDNSSTPSGTPGVGGAVQHYSLEISGNNQNCALSFKFQ